MLHLLEHPILLAHDGLPARSPTPPLVEVPCLEESQELLAASGDEVVLPEASRESQPGVAISVLSGTNSGTAPRVEFAWWDGQGVPPQLRAGPQPVPSVVTADGQEANARASLFMEPRHGPDQGPGQGPDQDRDQGPGQGPGQGPDQDRDQGPGQGPGAQGFTSTLLLSGRRVEMGAELGVEMGVELGMEMGGGQEGSRVQLSRVHQPSSERVRATSAECLHSGSTGSRLAFQSRVVQLNNNILSSIDQLPRVAY